MDYTTLSYTDLGQKMALFQIEADNLKVLHDNSVGQYISVDQGEYQPAQQYFAMQALLVHTEMANIQMELNVRDNNISGNRISRSQYEEFLIDSIRIYSTTTDRRPVGQMFLQRFWSKLKLTEPDTELFNQKDVSECISTIRTKYVNL